jgi:hypothetical protein
MGEINIFHLRNIERSDHLGALILSWDINMELNLKEISGRIWMPLSRFTVGSSGGLFKYKFKFFEEYKKLKKSWPRELVLASSQGICFSCIASNDTCLLTSI